MNEIPLQFPFTTAAGQKLEAVTPRRLKVRDLRSINDQAKGDPAQIELLGVARMVNDSARADFEPWLVFVRGLLAKSEDATLPARRFSATPPRFDPVPRRDERPGARAPGALDEDDLGERGGPDGPAPD